MIASEDIVEIKDLKKSYLMGAAVVEAVRGVSFTIKEGESVAITGPSGSGKSTVLNLLGALDTPTSGTYKLAGTDVSELDDDELSEIRCNRIGFIFQSFNLIPRLTVLDNISMPLFYSGASSHERKERAAELAELVGLGRRMHHRPNELSGGEMQRVAIARAMANDPAIILADEPTGNLDTKTGKEILRLLDEIWKKGATIITVTHDPRIASTSPRVIQLIDGLVVRDGMVDSESQETGLEGDIR